MAFLKFGEAHWVLALGGSNVSSRQQLQEEPP